jgi:hypothetical protein
VDLDYQRLLQIFSRDSHVLQYGPAAASIERIAFARCTEQVTQIKAIGVVGDCAAIDVVPARSTVTLPPRG